MIVPPIMPKTPLSSNTIKKSYEKLTALLDKYGINPLNMNFDKLYEDFKAHLKDVDAMLDQEGLMSLLAEAWNFEEIEAEEFTFLQCVQWLKKNLVRGKHAGGCLLRIREETAFKKSVKYKHHFILCFINAQNEPMLENEHYAYVYANSLDKDLLAHLGEKEMLILK